MKLWKRILKAAAASRWLVRRWFKDLIRIKITTTIQATPRIVMVDGSGATSSGSGAMGSGATGGSLGPPVSSPAFEALNDCVLPLACELCGRNPQIFPGNALCLSCSTAVPAYLEKKLPKGIISAKTILEVRPLLHAWQDAAKWN